MSAHIRILPSCHCLMCVNLWKRDVPVVFCSEAIRPLTGVTAQVLQGDATGNAWRLLLTPYLPTKSLSLQETASLSFLNESRLSRIFNTSTRTWWSFAVKVPIWMVPFSNSFLTSRAHSGRHSRAVAFDGAVAKKSRPQTTRKSAERCSRPLIALKSLSLSEKSNSNVYLSESLRRAPQIHA